MQHYDLCLAWNWEFDADFARLLETACARQGLTLLQVTTTNLDTILASLRNREIRFRAFLDRASESDPR
jgi:hypothetical protein